jgi:hypothetical protein
MSYPKADNLQAFMIGAGIPAPDTLDYARVLASIIAQWERDTNICPFIASDTSSQKSATVEPGGYIELSGVLTAQADSLTIEGGSVIPVTDYRYQPTVPPYSLIEIDTAYVGSKVIILGKWGYSTCPDDVYDAILCKAASSLSARSGESANGINGAVQSVQQGDVKIQYSAITTTKAEYTAQQIQLNSIYDATVTRYKRLVI